MSRQGQLGGTAALWAGLVVFTRKHAHAEAPDAILKRASCALHYADAITQGVPVLDDEYGRSRVAMAALVDKFAGLDLYDPERVKVSNNAYACNIRLSNI